MSTKAVAPMLPLHEHTVKDLDRPYMPAGLTRTPPPAPRGIGGDERSIKTGPTDRLVVRDLARGCPIWVGGQGRAEADLNRFFLDRGPKKPARIRLAVMDLWNAFRTSVQTQAPQAQMRFDKCPILRHLANAMDPVRRDEYNRVVLTARAFIQGQRDPRLAPRAHLTRAGRRSLQTLLRATTRRATADLLQEEFGQRGASRRAGWARQFVTRWREPLKGPRRRPVEKFATLIEKQWPGIVPSCAPRNQGTRGCVAGLTHKIRVIHRRASGSRDEEDLRLQILTAFLPKT